MSAAPLGIIQTTWGHVPTPFTAVFTVWTTSKVRVVCALLNFFVAAAQPGTQPTARSRCRARRFDRSPMPPSPKKSKKKTPIKASYSGVSFDKNAPAEAVEEGEVDPLASYRAAAAAASKALEKEREEEAQLKLFKKIFDAMDSDGDGKVELAEMIEAVAASTAPLSHRASSEGRPTGAVSLQLPLTFTLNQWIKEMRRMQAEMDTATFEVNVMGLFDCFKDAPAPPTPRSTGVDRTAMLHGLFAAMDEDSDGLIGVDDFLKQAKGSGEQEGLRDLFDFLTRTFSGVEGGQTEGGKLTREAFCEGTLTRTPIGRMRDAAFSSAIRGMKADVQRISSIRVAMKLAHGDSSADKRLDLLGSLFKAMDVENEGVVTMKGFTAQAKSALELEELKADFDSFDQVGVGIGMHLTWPQMAIDGPGWPQRELSPA